ncbi:hypothetical protein [Scopulibacillus cellulosilyticus]|uniref:Adenosylcobinamide-phosphate guanylyltransferase n=1 Tax=Scopulibacillus cellulosilyticus TaxID=2665665 RepID=A0ABW2PXI6_9BACL
MHFVTGGAFNGKRRWVKETYQLENKVNVGWLSGYDSSIHLDQLMNVSHFQLITVIEGWEQFIWQSLSIEKDPRGFWQDLIRKWQAWEYSGSNRQIIIIGVDISKGIVPIEEKQRLWRDVTGWCYQDAIKRCLKVNIIWYGLSQCL